MARHRGPCSLIALFILLSPWVTEAELLVESDSVIPGRIAGEESSGMGSLPLWLAADKAVRDGEIRWDLLPPHTRSYIELAERSVERAKQRGPEPPERCRVRLSVVGAEAGRVPAESTITSLSQSAERALTGRIVASRPGFLRGTPGTLYKLETAADTDGPSRVEYFFYPVVELRVGGAVVCFAPDDVDPVDLAVGREVALLLQPTERPATEPILMPLRGELIVRTPGDLATVLDETRVPAGSFSSLAEQVKVKASRRSSVGSS